MPKSVCEHLLLFSLSKLPGLEWLGDIVALTFEETVFSSGCTTSRSCWQGMKLPADPHLFSRLRGYPNGCQVAGRLLDLPLFLCSVGN